VSDRAQADFEVTSWAEKPFDEHEGIKQTRTRIVKNFTGEIEGTGTGEMLMVYLSDGDGVAYVGFERIEASVKGAEGSFVLHHTAGAHGVSWTVIDGSGRGQLTGIKGSGIIQRFDDGRHTFTLDYEIETPAAT
jgi:hypothetical protein